MLTRKRRVARAFGVPLAAACLLVASPAVSFAISPGLTDLNRPSLVIIEGYLDRVAPEAKVLDRIDIVGDGRRHTLLVTRYGTPGETGLDRYLSRVMAQPFTIEGRSEDVARLLNAPPGTKIAGTFAVYTQGAPSLLITDLVEPAPPS
ncbi:MAG: hypothetical protein ABW298_09635 [Candidatus Binatia bacterium]